MISHGHVTEFLAAKTQVSLTDSLNPGYLDGQTVLNTSNATPPREAAVCASANAEMDATIASRDKDKYCNRVIW